MFDLAPQRSVLEEGLHRLGVERLLVGIHDAAFPASSSDDTGRGSPYSPAGLGFVRFVRGLGFTGLQLGPQGEAPASTGCPYDGTHFSRSTLSISLARLVEDGLLPLAELERLVESRPTESDTRVQHVAVAARHRQALERAFSTFLARGTGAGSAAQQALERRVARFVQWSGWWLEADALFAAASLEHPGVDWRQWSGPGDARVDGRLLAPAADEEEVCERRRRRLARRWARQMDGYRFFQFLAHSQHDTLRDECRRLGVELFGDLAIGLGACDAWRVQHLLLPGYLLGAPPSRTNPLGQAWGYPVFDPRFYRSHPSDRAGESAGPAIRYAVQRLEKLLQEVDGLRIDHPHGLVCPWVYRSDADDPEEAVQRGARLFSSPALPDHPALADYAIVRRNQLHPDPETPRHADDWVVDLEPEQVERYAVLFDAHLELFTRHRPLSSLACEVLSTLPRPLARVLERYDLGRFRVTQKASLTDAEDVYRSENACPEDWILVGNHDTEPVWSLLDVWRSRGELEARARRLAALLVPEEPARGRFVERLVTDPSLLAQAHFAELFASPARNAMIYFTDLFGFEERYNHPGTVCPRNWSLRLPVDYESLYRKRLTSNRALNLPFALALALRSRPDDAGREAALLGRLEDAARSLCERATGWWG